MFLFQNFPPQITEDGWFYFGIKLQKKKKSSIQWPDPETTNSSPSVNLSTSLTLLTFGKSLS